ncbi:zinc finger FYVE domain-containing protein 1-like [Onthophagus taurus]|uniref:zinc finger FYVE domain-containing protein 1-like n=1 Tax=Onthophagus taurus TaxID=166361 RepID=UPI000C203B2A|nr:zinc finger FYVE domain-containing protein 1-like [Onthophagus taurus]XP_022905631.1 zinc finger FYVE domain-containing protein 1-like [Onthophagus taurus]
MPQTLAKTASQKYTNPSILTPTTDTSLNLSLEPLHQMGCDQTNLLMNRLESLPLHDQDSLLITSNELPSFLLLNDIERLCVNSPEEFLARLKIDEPTKKVKVVSIFGNTGDGKSHTLNQVFFKGNEVFKTSALQKSCTMGVWAAYDPNLDVICLDTEGLLGISRKQSQRTRLLLKVLAVSDVVIYRTRAERLPTDMYAFLGGASKAYNEHFKTALQQVWQKFENEPVPAALGPSLIIFHETLHTCTWNSCPSVEESPEDLLRAEFGKLNLECNAFSQLKYVGIQTKEQPTDFRELKKYIQLDLANSSVRSKRNAKVVFLTLKGLNDKFSSEIKNVPPQLHLKDYFACQVKCQSCNEGCTLSMGHKEEGEPHLNSNRCKFQHQFQNCVYLCKQCSKNGQRIIVKPSYQSVTEKSWTNLLSYVWSGYIIECRNCGEIYRSRQHWYGNKSPEEAAVLVEYVHVWPGGEFVYQDKNFVGSTNSIQKVLDSVTYLSDVVANVGSQPTNAVKTFFTETINPSYWRPDREIFECNKCKTPFPPTSKKHHCRSCGEGFCEKCSSKTQPVPSRGWRDPVRVCDVCYTENLPSLSQTIDDNEVKIRKFGETVISSISAVAYALEIPKDIIKDTARPSYWTPDSECLYCWCCEMPFGPIVPLHHCRECGKGVCDDCSQRRKRVPFRGWDYPVRVCKKCDE